MPLKLHLIVAACDNMGIGSKGELPWTLKKELAYFSRITKRVDTVGKINAVVMGRKTWDSIPTKFQPLPNRLNLVLTRNPTPLRGALSFSSWGEVMKELKTQYENETIEKVWVIGGNSIYKMAMESPYCHRIYLTRILHNFECDVFFPSIDPLQYKLIKDPGVPETEGLENGIRFRYEVYERFN